ncbi:related to Acetylcholinesterase precursor [Ustilago bromivora]|uniref:Diphthamide biosynthesis protein 4 n=1 Tax=Ustilago bromivora TaxID=307758 RepID=A0A8H8QM57_9BASI|nr:related to Acetylcholinesterase precursor [Ustilago bromivora]
MGQSTNTFIKHDAASVTIPNQGHIIGRIAQDTSTAQLKSQRFTGIPFAQPPIGSLRWKRPLPLSPTFRYDSNNTEYSSFAAQCPQPTNYALTNGITIPDRPTFGESEDCLYLNIWCPVQTNGSRLNRKLPVLFFVHGGWLQIGNAHFSPDKDPSDLIHAGRLEAVVVTAGYRLNLFGFLAHEALRKEDPDCLTGNYGFWDQRAALEWIHNNISHFGGDPDNITVGGLSAGAHSTHSQLMHEFDLSTRHPSYKPIISRVFLQSNSAIWPSKPVAETSEQLDELCSLLNIDISLSGEDKIAKLREVHAGTLAKTVGGMKMHTFRATRDGEERAFVKADWTKAMMDGRFAKWCEKEGVTFLMGECEDEEWVYRYINTPADTEGLVRQVNNYYTLPLVEKMLPLYGVEMSTRSGSSAKGSKEASQGLKEEDKSLYDILGVKASATSTKIRSAYLAQVRLYHPDKLQQQQQHLDPTAIADSLPQSDQFIRQLNHAYKTLIDNQTRSSYDEKLAALRAASSSSTQPRISQTIDFESFQPTEPQASAGPMTFDYPCRCGSSYFISEDQIHDRIELISCNGCSDNIRVRYDDDDNSHHSPSTADEIAEIFGHVCSDSQVYIAQRILITDLIKGGLPPERILRYRIEYRAKVIDDVLPGYRGVSHSFDDYLWWFSSLKKEEKELVGSWLEPYKAFVKGEDVHGTWYGGRKAEAAGRLIRVLGRDGAIEVKRDERWDEKEELVEGMIRIRKELAESL